MCLAMPLLYNHQVQNRIIPTGKLLATVKRLRPCPLAHEGRYVSATIVLVLVLVVFGEVQREDTGQQQDVVFSRRDVYAVGRGQADPLLRDGRHDLPLATDRELVLEEAPFHLEVVWRWHVNGEAIDERAEQLLADFGDLLPGARDLIGRAQRDETLAHLCDLAVGGIADDPRVVEREELALNVQHDAASLLCDIRVFAEAEHLLADDLTHAP